MVSEEYTNKSIELAKIINRNRRIVPVFQVDRYVNRLDDGIETPVWKCVQEMEDEWVQKRDVRADSREKLRHAKDRPDMT